MCVSCEVDVRAGAKARQSCAVLQEAEEQGCPGRESCEIQAGGGGSISQSSICSSTPHSSAGWRLYWKRGLGGLQWDYGCVLHLTI